MKRYFQNPWQYGHLVESPDGPWVRWEDVEAERNRLRNGIRDIALIAAAHHDHQQSHLWLHALTIDIPHLCDLLLQAEKRQPLCHPSRFDDTPDLAAALERAKHNTGGTP